MENITKYQNSIKNNISKSFVENEYQEVYSAESIKNYIKDLQKSFNNNDITLDEFEKGKKDLSRLAMRRMVDKNGHQRLVYVKVHEDEKGNTKETDFDEGDSVKFTKDGKEYNGKVKKLKYHDKTDKVGTAIVEVDGIKSPFSVSLAKLSNTNSGSEDDAMENAKKAGAKASREGNDAEARKQADIYRDLQSKKTNNGAEKTSNSEIKTGDYVKMSDKGPFTVTASQHKGKTFKVVGEVDSGLISQPKFLKLKDVESGEEVEVNPRDFVKANKKTEVKEVKSNKKDSYPDNQGGKNNSIADGMQDMSDKAKANGDTRRAELYQKYADEHRAEAKAWFEKNGGEGDGKSTDEKETEIKIPDALKYSLGIKDSNMKFNNFQKKLKELTGIEVRAEEINGKIGYDIYHSGDGTVKGKLFITQSEGIKDTADAMNKLILKLAESSQVQKIIYDKVKIKRSIKKGIDELSIQKAFNKLGSF